MHIIVIGICLNEKRQVDSSFVNSWAAREKIKYFEISVHDRYSLFPPFTYLASKMNVIPTKSSFAPLGIVTKKTKE